MSAQLELGGMPDPRPRWAEYDACFTPPAVVEQLFVALRSIVDVPRRGRLLDPCAGAGVFGMVARRRLRAWEIVAVEPREEERAHLEQHYDTVVTGTAQAYGQAAHDSQFFDIVCTNPPWWCWGDIFDAVWPLVIEGGALALLGPSTWGHSDEASERIDVFERVTPAHQLRVRGRIAFNGSAGTDNRKCSWWLWRNDGVARDSWTTLTLPALPAEARRWTTRPGTETP